MYNQIRMSKINSFFKWFNRPGQLFESFGYLTVLVGIIVAIRGIEVLFQSFGSIARGDAGLGIIFIGILVSFVGSQVFFAVAKIVRAADKYLNENDTK